MERPRESKDAKECHLECQARFTEKDMQKDSVRAKEICFEKGICTDESMPEQVFFQKREQGATFKK